MLNPTTGYILLSDFGENTDQELGRALRDLNGKGMRRLVFDLRGNPGGALDQAIRVANRFLPRGDLIVYTRGRVANSDQDYRATQQSDYLEIPMITLVNRNSASASEIVSGALQDHDRSLIVGETTFGKALVQSVYRVSGGAGVAVTTARYYTPSGRLIQRPWDGTFDEYLTYTLREQDAAKVAQARGSEVHRRGAARVQRRRRRAGSPLRRSDRRVQSDALRPDALRAESLRHLRAAVCARRRQADHREPVSAAARADGRLPGDRRDGGRVQGTRAEVAGHASTRPPGSRTCRSSAR